MPVERPACADSGSDSGIGCAVNGGMKLMLLILLVAGSAVAQSQTGQAAKETKLRQVRPARTSVTNEIRIVEGKPYHVNGSNWGTLPGPNERARYSRTSNYGPVFKLEKRIEARYEQGSNEGTRVWYELIREIFIKNYPEQKLVADALLPSIRAVLFRTTSGGIVVYDCGIIPKAWSDR